jgi:hypothetical protein
MTKPIWTPVEGPGDLRSLEQPKPERRAAPRYRCRSDGPSRLIIARRYECRWTRARDVSTNGLSLLVSGPLEPGTLAFLRLQGRLDSPPLTLLAEVIHATEQPDGNWIVGCKFDSVCGDLTPAERLKLQDLFQQSDSEPGDQLSPESFPKPLVEKLYYPFAPIF